MRRARQGLTYQFQHHASGPVAQAAGPLHVPNMIAISQRPRSGPGGAIPASAVNYSAGTITKVGAATYVANDPGDLTNVAAAVTATAITGTTPPPGPRRSA